MDSPASATPKSVRFRFHSTARAALSIFLGMVAALALFTAYIQTDCMAQEAPAAAVEAQSIPGIKYIAYKVRSGDTLGNLAEYFGTTVENIKILNRLQSNDLYVGQSLMIPASYFNYKVVSGDILALIAKRFGTTVEKILLFNGLTGSSIYPGQILHIPSVPQAPSVSYITHTVASGENPWTLSQKYGIPRDTLLAANGLTTSSVLQIGQKLRIPVYAIPIKPTPGPQYGEYLDWWTEAQYLFPIGRNALVRDFVTGKTFHIKRTIGASHADCEPSTSADASIIKALWGGTYAWTTRAIIVEVDGRRIAASMSSMPHGIQYIDNNGFNGHFDIHFRNSTRHKDNAVDLSHQAKIKISAGIR